ncbi:MAG: tRNA uridine-5-carboxymethylaminomethyl(34) synthesis GTPase MnmE [Candidatus Schekmanbacteria bacterium]|nr:tRNA uridine-5-carboxymethylaminomethyl(34) synthesis GTPase MnmE [Candidatus Schekmanbacteria bacterium]
MQDTDTIVAVATPPGEGGVGIVRLSGPTAQAVAACALRSPAGAALAAAWPARTVRVGLLVDPGADGEVIDEVIFVYFAAPRSYTTEDVIEIHCHGSPAVLRRAVSLLVGLGARLAEPGEFTRRAFEAGRLDLNQAEAVADLIRARSDAARRLAVTQLRGGLATVLAASRQALASARARIEAAIDFPDEDLDLLDPHRLIADLTQLREGLAELLENGIRARVLKEGLTVVLAGRPNVGKSALLNALLGKDRAIVDATPGTTRDFLAEEVLWHGSPFTLVDTAGLRADAGEVERLGMERARAKLAEADVVLFVLEATAGWTPEDRAIFAELSDGDGGGSGGGGAGDTNGHSRSLVLVWNKIDLLDTGWRPTRLGEATETAAPGPFAASGVPALWLSATRGDALDELRALLRERLRERAFGAEAHEVLALTIRHEQALQSCCCELDRAVSNLGAKQPVELAALDLQRASRFLGELAGETTSDAVLAEIFNTFCVGK